MFCAKKKDAYVVGGCLVVCLFFVCFFSYRLYFCLFFYRSIVRERCPTFSDSFVEACLLLVGKIANVWGSLDECARLAGGSGNPLGGVAVEDSKNIKNERYRPSATAISMLDMLLAPSGCRDTRARVSAREAFRFVFIFVKKSESHILSSWYAELLILTI